MQDGAEHARLRGLVEEAFARVAVDGLTDDITAIADRLLDRIEADRPVDIITAYTRELPFEVICVMLGIPEAERPYLVQRLKPISSAGSIPAALWAMVRMAPLVRRMRSYYRGGARQITTGLVGALNSGSADGSRLTEDEFVAMVFMLFVAGHETTVHLINNALLALTERPDLRRHFRAAPGDIPIFVEEVMRHASPVMMTKMLFVRQDCDFMGVRLRKGEMVTGLLIAANHDPARYTNPEDMIPDRRPNPQLGFGFGPHVCLGMQLARAEARIAIERLLMRFENIETAAPVVWSGRAGIHAPRALVLRLRP
jgi:cytochrome P450 PksS